MSLIIQMGGTCTTLDSTGPLVPKTLLQNYKNHSGTGTSMSAQTLSDTSVVQPREADAHIKCQQHVVQPCTYLLLVTYFHVICIYKRNKNLSRWFLWMCANVQPECSRFTTWWMWCMLKCRKVGFCLFELSKELWHTLFFFLGMVGKIIFPLLLVM